MASKPKPPPSLRRASARPAIPGRKPPGHLAAAADAGILTRATTAPGSRGRQAVDRVTYRRRTLPSRLKVGETVREATGHARPEVQEAAAISAYLDQPAPFVIFDRPTRLEKQRAGRYAHLQRELAAGKISPRQFQRRVESWAPIRDGQRFLADPERVLAVMEARRAADEPTFHYISGRAA